MYEKVKNIFTVIGTAFTAFTAIMVGFLAGRKSAGNDTDNGKGMGNSCIKRTDIETDKREADELHREFRDVVERVEKRRAEKKSDNRDM